MKSLKAQFSIALAIFIVIAITLLVMLNMVNLKSTISQANKLTSEQTQNSLAEQFKSKADTMAALITDDVANHLYHTDYSGIDRTMTRALNIKDISAVQLFDGSGNLIYDGVEKFLVKDKTANRETNLRVIESKKRELRVKDNLLEVTSPVLIGEDAIGGVRATFSMADMNHNIKKLTRNISSISDEQYNSSLADIAAIALAASLLVIFALVILLNRLLDPIASLADATNRMDKGEYSVNLPVERRDEVGQLAETYTKMRKEIWDHKISMGKQEEELERKASLRIEELLKKTTELESTQQTLLHASRKYEELFNISNSLLMNCPVGILRINKELEVVYLNNEMERLLCEETGVGSDFTAMKIMKIPQFQSTAFANALISMEDGNETVVENKFLSRFGKEIYLSLKCTPVMENGRFDGAVIFVTDITESRRVEEGLRRAKEEAEKKSMMKSELLVNMGHDSLQPRKNSFAGIADDTDRIFNIMLVGDFQLNDQSPKTALEELGHKVAEVDTGMEAVEKWENGDFDALLMDGDMPFSSGIDATMLIRFKEKSPINRTVIIGATVDKRDTQKYLSSGMDDHLQKPVDIDLLIQTIDLHTRDRQN